MEETIIKIIKQIDGKKNKSKIIRGINKSFSYSFKMFKELEDKQIIKKQKDGRQVFCILTDKGIKIRNLLIELEKLW